MKTMKDYYNMAFHEWFYQEPKGYLIYISDVEYTASRMAYLAAEMILRGEY